jgi:hypothetical protein
METIATITQDSYSPATNIWVKIIIIIQLSLLAVQFNPEPSTNGDNAIYYALGKSIADGTGYRRILNPDLPVESTYPVVFPMLIAATQIIADNPVFPQILMGVLGALVTLLCYYLFRRSLPPILLLPLLILVAFSRLLMEYQILLMSEMPYIVLTLAALLLLEKSADKPTNRLLFWATILVSVLPMHCRTIGVAFSGAWIGGNILAKRYRYAVAHAVLLSVTFGAFALSTAGSSAYGSLGLMRNEYDPEMGSITFGEMIMRILENIKIQTTILFPKSFLFFSKPPPQVLLLTLYQVPSLLALAGWLKGLFGRDRTISFYLFLYTCIMLVWRVGNDRYIACILPFLFYFMITGLRVVVNAARMLPSLSPAGLFALLKNPENGGLDWKGRCAVWAVVVAVVSVNLYARANYADETRLTPDWTNFYSCADWVRENTPPDAVVMSRKPELVYLRSRHRGMVYPYSHDVDRIVDAMKTAGVRYVIYDNFSWTQTTLKYLYPVIISHPDYFKIVYALNNPYTFVFEFAPK